mmetsp:Transcript_45445/g.119379  ORF Transcript_45445/g.119379 Transcript_45445/m.119379 type:complete len:274 (+) Transcript_45445:547-1368(+)
MSDASCAALTESCLGITSIAVANSAIASCSREPSDVAKFSRWMDSADSTQPPPGTTLADSSARLMAQRASCSERSTSSSICMLAPRSSTEQADWDWPPLMIRWSSSAMRSSITSSAVPSISGVKDSLPSMSANVIISCAPVSFAIRLRSSFLTRRTASAPASTKYLIAMSSMPLVVSTTLAPALSSSWMRSRVMSASFCRMSSSFFGSLTTTETPICILLLRRSMSSNAILAFLMVRGMPCPARPPYMTYPLISCESLNERPCCLMMPTDLTG